jgi:phosphotriesterase-related protein
LKDITYIVSMLCINYLITHIMKIKNFSVLIFMIIFLSQCRTKEEGIIMTVNGPLSPRDMGITLTHEHILVDFIGADSINESRWDKSQVIEKALPFLKEIRMAGCKTLVECTPAFLGRDPLLLKALSDSSGLNILTNTGYYGAGNNKYLPDFAFTETADELSGRWVREWKEGIDNTGIRPGFIKIGVAGDSLSDLHKKLVVAAALTHLATGLTIASHTGPAILAFEEIDILKNERVSPGAFIWVHAQNEKDHSNHIKAAEMGAWVSLDGINDDNIEEYVSILKNMKDNNLLNRVLLSHDAGWYHPGEENGGDFRGYATLFKKLIPRLKEEKFSDTEINNLLVNNPASAFLIKVRNLKDTRQ